MNKIVLDASALLAVLNREPGADRLTPEMLNMATSSTVNLAEVQGKLVSLGLAPGDAWEATLSPFGRPRLLLLSKRRLPEICLPKLAHWACHWETEPV
jgi:hypothetical protein